MEFYDVKDAKQAYALARQTLFASATITKVKPSSAQPAVMNKASVSDHEGEYLVSFFANPGQVEHSLPMEDALTIFATQGALAAAEIVAPESDAAFTFRVEWSDTRVGDQAALALHGLQTLHVSTHQHCYCQSHEADFARTTLFLWSLMLQTFPKLPLLCPPPHDRLLLLVLLVLSPTSLTNTPTVS